MIDINKKYRTRDGREVRIYATDGGCGGNAVHGAFKNDEGRWIICSWTCDGVHHINSQNLDLIEVRPRIKRTVWLNVYRDTMTPQDSKEVADMCALEGRFACVQVEIDCEEGEGL